MARPGAECKRAYFFPAPHEKSTSFTRDIYPILKRTVLISWVVEQSNRHRGVSGNFLTPARLGRLADKSGDSKAARQGVFNKLMKPNTNVRPNIAPPAFGQSNMPCIVGLIRTIRYKASLRR